MHESLGIKNIGPETEDWLRKVGIHSKAQFEKLGAERIYVLLLEHGHPHDETLRFMLLGAQEDIDWHILAQREKQIENTRVDIDEP